MTYFFKEKKNLNDEHLHKRRVYEIAGFYLRILDAKSCNHIHV